MMRQLKHYLYAACGLLVLAGVLSMIGSREVYSQAGGGTLVRFNQTDPNNRVRIDPSLNTVTVGNTPTVNVGNTPNVRLDPTATNSVSIAGTPTVGIAAAANTVKLDPTNLVSVRSVDEPARQNFQFQVTATVPEGSRSVRNGFTVPDGKFMVIEFVSAQWQVPLDQKPSVAIATATRTGASSITHYLVPFFRVRDGGLDVYNAAQEMRFYTPNGGVVQIDVGRDLGVAGTASVTLSISGYMVNAA